jgi:aryl-alcohol dehydrogenase-like predicted oxidoreductase
MEYRRLGNTGMYVSEIAYGNWITHGNQVEATAANACVKAAFDAGITTRLKLFWVRRLKE